MIGSDELPGAFKAAGEQCCQYWHYYSFFRHAKVLCAFFQYCGKNTSISSSHNSYSKSQSGIEYVLLGLISNSFPPLGFPLNDQLFQLIVRRYSDEKGNMDFDNFIGCLVRLDAMCRTLTEYLAVSSQAQFLDSWLALLMFCYLQVPSRHLIATTTGPLKSTFKRYCMGTINEDHKKPTLYDLHQKSSKFSFYITLFCFLFTVVAADYVLLKKEEYSTPWLYPLVSSSLSPVIAKCLCFINWHNY